jgi:hypothetical protein
MSGETDKPDVALRTPSASNDDVEASVAEVKAKAAARTRGKKVASSTAARNASMKQILEAAREGKEVDYSTFARRMVEKRQDDEAAAMDAARKIDPVLKPMFYRCRHCEGPAIYFVKNPIGAGRLTSKDWFSTYKKPDEPWARTTVPCQTCLGLTKMVHGINVVWMPDETGFGEIAFRLDAAAMRRIYTYDTETGEERAAMMTKTRKISEQDIAAMKRKQGDN